jgi:hypothetical protein
VTSTSGGFFAMPHELQGVESPEPFQNLLQLAATVRSSVNDSFRPAATYHASAVDHPGLDEPLVTACFQ